MTQQETAKELPWTVDAECIGELLLDMHNPNCSDGDGTSETGCRACLCRHALFRLAKKTDRLEATLLGRKPSTTGSEES